MANISRPIRPSLSSTARTWPNTAAMASRERLTKSATVVKCGLASPVRATKSTLSRQARSMARELTMPWE